MSAINECDDGFFCAYDPITVNLPGAQLDISCPGALPACCIRLCNMDNGDLDCPEPAAQCVAFPEGHPLRGASFTSAESVAGAGYCDAGFF